jgi:hypothetical protein
MRGRGAILGFGGKKRLRLVLAAAILALPGAAHASDTPFLDAVVKDAIQAASDQCITANSKKGNEAISKIEQCALKGAFDSSTDADASLKALKTAIRKKNSYLNALFEREAIQWDQMHGKDEVDRRFSRTIEKLLSQGKLDLARAPELKKYLDDAAKMHSYRQTFRVMGSRFKPARCVLPELNVYDTPDSLPTWFPIAQWPKCQNECRPKLVGSDFECKPIKDWPRKRNVSVKEVLPESLGALDKCAAGLEAAKAYGQVKVPGVSEICGAIQNTELAPFSSEAVRFVSHMKVQDYFELLRVEAIARVQQAQRNLFGKDFVTVPPHCERFRDGIEAFRRNHPATMEKRTALLQSPEFAAQVQANAKTTQALMDALSAAQQEISRCPTRCDPKLSSVGGDGPRACVLNFDPACVAPIQDQAAMLQVMIADSVAAFPFLAVGHDPRKENYEDLPRVKQFSSANPAEIGAQIAKDSGRMTGDLIQMMSKFCEDTSEENVSDLLDLAQNTHLTAPLLAKFPQFAEFQDKCIVPELKARQSTGKALGIGAALGSCVIPGVGFFCADLFVLGSAVDFNEAQVNLYKCSLYDGNAVCSSEERDKARERYSQARTQLGLAAVFSVGEKAFRLGSIAAKVFKSDPAAQAVAKAGGGVPGKTLQASPEFGTIQTAKAADLSFLDVMKLNHDAKAHLSAAGARTRFGGGTAFEKEPYWHSVLENANIQNARLKDIRTFELESVAGKGQNSPLEVALNHPEMNDLIRKIHAQGCKINVDPGLSLSDALGIYSPNLNEIRILPNTPFKIVLHEYQHLLFQKLQEVIPYSQILDHAKTLSLPELLEGIKGPMGDSLKALEDEGLLFGNIHDSAARGLPETAANETVAVQAEMNALKQAGFKPFDEVYQSRELYAVSWQIHLLEKIPAAERSAVQSEALDMAIGKKYLAEMVRSGQAAGGAAVAGLGMILVNEKLKIAVVRAKDGTYKTIDLKGLARELQSGKAGEILNGLL